MALALTTELRRRWESPVVAPVIALVAANVVLLVGATQGFALLLLALAVVAPVAAAILRRPQMGILILVALVPFDGLLVIIPHPVIVDGWKEALTIATLLATFVCPAEARGKEGRPLPRWLPALTILIGLGVVSAAVGGGLLAIYGLKVYFFSVLVVLAVWRCPLDERERDRFVTILMVVGFITAVVGIGQQFVDVYTLNSLGYEFNSVIRFNGNFLRSFSTFDQPFGFGYFMMIVILIGLPIALADPRRPRNQLFLVLLPIFGIGLLTSIVRGAWLGVAIGAAYLGHRYRVLLLALPLALVALFLLPSDVSASALSSKSSHQRVEHWTENFAPIFGHPFGAGIGVSGSAAEKVQRLQGQDVDYFQPDNYYLLIAYELGPLGLWWFVLLLISAFGAARLAARVRAGPDAAFADGTTALVLAAAAASAIASVFQISPVDLFFWSCLAIVAVTPGPGEPAPALDAQRVASMR